MTGLPAQGSFDDPQTERILDRVLQGRISKSEASRKLGVSRETIYKWLIKYSRLKQETTTPEISEQSRKYSLRHDVLRIAAGNPKLGPKKIASELSKRGKNISNRSVWLVLKGMNLQTRQQRENYAYQFRKPAQAKDPRFPGHLRLKAETRKRMIEEVLLSGRKVGGVIKEYGVTRKTYAKWKYRYQKASERGESILFALSDQNPEGSDHPNGANERTERAVLNHVVLRPELSSAKIAKKLGFIGNHGVQNILNRNNLNRYELRLAYSKAQHIVQKPIFTRVLDRIRLVLEQFIPSLAPAPPPSGPVALWAGGLASFLRFLRTFAITSILTLAVSYTLFSWINLISSRTPADAIGLIFATTALFMGSVFFIYSLKYYITLAIVLSFSQQDPNPPAGGRGKRGFVSWLLGIRGQRVVQDKESEKSIGLTPNLEHIVLKKHPFVSVHIPLFNEKNVVERAIKAASNFEYPEYEVILADDSTDETSQIIRDYLNKFKVPRPRQAKRGGQSSKLKVIRGEGWTMTQAEIRPGVTLKHLHRTSRSGFKGGALKLALSVCDPRTEFVSVFDADFVPYPDTLELFLKYFQATAGTLDFRGQRLEDRKEKPSSNVPSPNSSPIAAVQGYQWHVLNKSENWVTRGVRSEYAGSYVIERSGEEIYSGLKQISGAVYMIRRDVLQEVGWETSITEDFELTLKLYEKGYKVVYTPYIQAPAECVSTLQRLIKQRMRWAEGHSNNIRKMFSRLILSKNLTSAEKLEVMYLSPYYLQAFFFLVGTVSWLISETIFPARLPFWTSLWGWSLVLTNLISLPLMNAVGLFLEESEERDYAGILSFIALTYIVVPFQAYAALKGFLERKEGPWFRTPKTGRITDVFARGRFYRFISGILPGRAQPAMRFAGSPYLALSTANSQFNSFSIKPRRRKWLGKVVLSILLALSVTVYSMTRGVPVVEATNYTDPFYLYNDLSSVITSTVSDQLVNTTTIDGVDLTEAQVSFAKNAANGSWLQFAPTVNNSTLESGTDCTTSSLDGRGWVWDTAFEQGGTIASGTWTFYIRDNDTKSQTTGHFDVCVWAVTVTSGSVDSPASQLIYESQVDGSWSTADIWNAGVSNPGNTTSSISQVTFNVDEYLYVEYYAHITADAGSSGTRTQDFATGNVSDPQDPRIVTPTVTIPESAIVFLAATPLIPYLVNLWLKKRKDLAYA